MSRRQAAEFNAEQGATSRSLRGVLRRMAVSLTRRATNWQLLGHRIRGQQQETSDAEPFTGIGFYSRPRESSNAEAVLAQIGEARHVVIIALRDEDLRKLWGDELVLPDVAAIYNSLCVLVTRPDGTIHAKSLGGTAVQLCTLADAQAIRSALDGHSHTYVPGSGTPTLTTGNPSVPAPVGTQVFKAE